MSQVELYIGQPIEYESERTALHHIYDILKSARIPAVLMANFQVNGTQVDLVIGFEGYGIVLEIKGCQREIQGLHNGGWSLRSSSGHYTATGNYYQQTLNAGYRVKDYLTGLLNRNVGYPNATLLLVPALPPGSAIVSSDHKVSVKNLSELTSFNIPSQQNGCSLQEWRQFAGSLSLIPVHQAADAWDQSRLPGIKLIQHYAKNFESLYAPEISHLIPVQCKIGNDVVLSDQLKQQIGHEANVLVSGEAGCGKSLLAKRIGLDALQTGGVPIIIEAKDFAGKLRPMLEEEFGLLGVAKLSELFSLTSYLEKHVILIIDGINECRQDLRPRLLRNLRIICDRYLLRCVLVTQPGCVDAALLNPLEIVVLPPSLEIKRRIALKHAAPEAVLRLNSLLEVVNTGLEARMIGEIASEPVGALSRFELFDLYVRKKLGTDGQRGIALLAMMAGNCAVQMSYNLTISELGRLMEQHDIEERILEKARERQLLRFRLHKVNFVHELFLQFFTAEAVIRASAASGDNIEAVMRDPKYAKERLWILGGLRDIETIARCVRTIQVPELLQELYYGEAGPGAALLLNQECSRVIDKMRIEIRQLVFKIGDNDFYRIEIEPASGFEWSGFEVSLILLIGRLNVAGKYVAEIMALVQEMDNRLEYWRTQLQEEARQNGFSLKKELFDTAYVGVYSERSALTRLFDGLQSGNFHFLQKRPDMTWAHGISMHSFSLAQLYYLLILIRNDDVSKHFYAVIKDALSKWHSLPYHLQLSLLEIVGYCWSTDEERNELGKLINEAMQSEENIWLSSWFIDALNALGQLEEDLESHREQVIQEVAAVVQNNSADVSVLAWGLYSKQFDHPYDIVYCECIDELLPQEKEIFYEAALRGAIDTMFIPLLIYQTAKLIKEKVCFLLERFRFVSGMSAHFPSVEFDVLLMAYIYHGRYNYPLVSFLSYYNNTCHKAIASMAEIYYWINRTDMDKVQVVEHCKPLWTIIHSDCAELSCSLCSEVIGKYRVLATDPLRFDFPVNTIKSEFAHEILICAQRALLDPSSRKSVYKFPDSEKQLNQAIQFIVDLGDSTHIALLKTVVNDPDAGEAAVAAIRKLKEK